MPAERSLVRTPATTPAGAAVPFIPSRIGRVEARSDYNCIDHLTRINEPGRTFWLKTSFTFN